jgi:hypothetical protein
MQKSNPPERVLRRAGVTGLPAHATDTQKVGALQLKGRGKPRPLLFVVGRGIFFLGIELFAAPP